MGLREIIRGFLTLLCYQTSWSYLGRQGLGLKFVLLWVARRRERRQRIMEHCQGALNTNPFVAGVVVGSILRAEDEAHELQRIDRMASVAQSTLAAGGDRFFWQTVRPALAALSVLLGLFGIQWATLPFLLGFAGAAQATRIWGLRTGYEQGRAAISILQQSFDRWGRVLGCFAAIVTGMLVVRGGLDMLSVKAGYLFLPAALLAYAGLGLRISQSYLLVSFLLIFLAAKVVL